MEKVIVSELVLVVLAVTAGITDLLKKKIFNWLTFPAIIYGFAVNIILNVNGPFEGFKVALFGFIVGLAVFLPFFIAGGFGGGDLKFMAGIGAIKGWLFLLNVCIYAALFGGIVSVVILFRQKKLLKTVKRAFKILLYPFFRYEIEKPEKDSTAISFGVFISIGVLLALFFP